MSDKERIRQLDIENQRLITELEAERRLTVIRIKALTDGLRKYGGHTKECDFLRNRTERCVCGYSNLIESEAIDGNT